MSLEYKSCSWRNKDIIQLIKNKLYETNSAWLKDIRPGQPRGGGAAGAVPQGPGHFGWPIWYIGAHKFESYYAYIIQNQSNNLLLGSVVMSLRAGGATTSLKFFDHGENDLYFIFHIKFRNNCRLL